MSLKQLCNQLDLHLKDTFERDDLNSKEWFAELERLAIKHRPQEYLIMKPYDIVLAYVKFKAQND